MPCEVCEKIVLEIIADEDDITLDVDFEGEIISGTTGEEYQNGYDKGYDSGYQAGKTVSYENGYDAGQKAEHDAFWDSYQQDGERTNYTYGFAGSGWATDIFKPKYDIIPNTASYLFYGASNITGDLVEHLSSLGVKLDFSNCTNFSWLIYGSLITRVGVIDMTNVSSSSNANNVFREGNPDFSTLETIDKVIVSSKYPLGTSSFANAAALRNITIEGEITGSFAIARSPLTNESMKSIITHLTDYSGTDNEFVYTVSFLSTSWENLDAEGNTSPNGNTWREYINDLGWNAA